MSNYSQLKAAINAAITANGQNEITGTILNQILTAMVNSLGAGYHCMGVATPSTNPNSPDQNVFYFATEGGTYSNFGGIILEDGISVLLWNGSWTSQTWFTIDNNPTSGSSNLVMSGGVFAMINRIDLVDVAGTALKATQKTLNLRYNEGTEEEPNYIVMSELVLGQATDEEAGLLPAKSEWDDEPTAESQNLVKSGGLYNIVGIEPITETQTVTGVGFVAGQYHIAMRSGVRYKIRATFPSNIDGIAFYPYYAQSPSTYIDLSDGDWKEFTPEYNVGTSNIYVNVVESQSELTLEVQQITTILKIEEDIANLENINLQIENEIFSNEKTFSASNMQEGFLEVLVNQIDIVAGKTYKITVQTSDSSTIVLYYNNYAAGHEGDYIDCESGVPTLFTPDVSYHRLLFYIQSGQTGLNMSGHILMNPESLQDRVDVLEQKTQEIEEKECQLSISMFSKIGVCGDSYTSGTLFNPLAEIEEISWGKIMGRLYGTSVSVFASGGADTNTWQERASCLPALLGAEAKELYIIALGINDAAYVTLGTIADIHQDYTENPNTFYGNYGRIIDQIKAHAPNAKIALCKVLQPRLGGAAYPYSSSAIEEIANHYGISFLETKDSDFLMSDWYLNNLEGGHPTAIEYSGIAKAVASLMEKEMYSNTAYYGNYRP